MPSSQTLDQAFRLHTAGDLAAAAPLYREILSAEPRNGDALNLLGALVLQQGQTDEAVALLERAVATNPAGAAFLGNLGAAYMSAGRNEEALRVLTRAVQLRPNLRDICYNLAIANYNLGLMEESLAAYERSLEFQPDDPRTNNNLGNICLEMGRTEEALLHLEVALRLEPGMPTAHYNRGLALLRLGRFAEGWPEYEWRNRTGEVAPRRLLQPTWDGTALPHGTLLVHAEQGLGDTIQLIRYLPLLRKLCPNTIVEVQGNLIPLLEQSGFSGLVAQRSPLPPFDVQISLSSLPGMLGTTLENVPAEVPYLHARPALVDAWRARLATYSEIKVGIAWQGSPTYREDRYRSIPLVYFSPLARVPGVQLFSLQKGAGAEQIAQLRQAFHVVDLMADADGETGPFMDTAALIRNLDLVITSDTSVAHLAGALGVPVWVALRIGPDWRWLDKRADSPWYPTMRLFRQPAFGDWPSVFTAMALKIGGN